MSEPFLKLVASDLLEKFPGGMHNVRVVFPGKRARLFLNNHILSQSDSPLWAPTAITMQELFLSMSPYSIIDPIEAVCILYRIYLRHLPDDAESLDRFFGWGQVMLNDFDDIDKHLVDAHALFTNIKDLEDLTSDKYLTPEQEETLKRFFATFSVESNTQLRERFRRMWAAMPGIYDDFVSETTSLGRVTEGTLYRDVAARLKNGGIVFPENHVYAFVGLNALNTVEKFVMHHLQAANQALFYWDYDEHYVANAHEAGVFMRDNLKEFKNEIHGREFSNLSDNATKSFTYVATAGFNVQARYIPTWLESLRRPSDSDIPDTAIVLCDEKMLEPVLHAIPDTANGGPRTANITMGFPLTSTPAYSLVRSVLNLYTNGWDEQTQRFRTYERRIVERHPYLREEIKAGNIVIAKGDGSIAWLTKYLADLMAYVAGRQKEKMVTDGRPKAAEELSPDENMTSESIFRVYNVLKRVEDLIDRGLLNVSLPCLSAVIDQILHVTSVPFHGEPAEGLQIMGILETRCLDFDNLLLLSVGEGNMPQNGHTPSFIPYSLRAPFQLTTIEHRVAIEAYYFYRLLQRAKNITFVYDTACSDGVKNEMSRFLRQLLVEMRPDGNFPDKAISIKPDVSLPHGAVIEAAKTDAVIKKLKDLERISPTALESYISCPIKYYLHYIGGVDEYQEKDDEMDAATFGKIFHGAAETIYREFAKLNRPLTHDDFERFIGKDHGKQGWHEIQFIVNEQLYEHYLKPRKMSRDNINGALALQRDVLAQYVLNLLRHDDRTLDSMRRQVVRCESNCSTVLPLSDGSTVTVGGIIDRLDLVSDLDGKNHRFQVIDYKTMSRHEPAPKGSMDLIFSQEKKYHSHIFQTFIYSLTLLEKGLPIQPTVFYTQDSSSKLYTTDIIFNDVPLTDIRGVADEFRQRLIALLDGIFDRHTNFRQTANPKHCAYCPFADICRIH